MKNPDFKKIIKELQHFPELEPPSNIVNNVMKRVTKPKQNWISKTFQFFFTSQQISFRPVTLAVPICIFLIIGYVAPSTHVRDANIAPITPKTDIISQAMQDTEASFLMGRGLMAAGLTAEALPLLQKASTAAPNNPDYAFWTGLCFSANNMPHEERASYQQAIESSPDNPSLLLNLGHSFLEEHKYDDALVYYNQVLTLDDREQVALYNTALIYHLQTKKKDEETAWKTYLDHYRYGINAIRAVQHLNNLDDFTYRIYYIGKLKIILNQKELLNVTPQQTYTYNADKLSRYLLQNPSLQLDIVTYNVKGRPTAKQNAVQLKRYLVNQLGPSLKNRIRLSWFGEKETLQTQTGNKQLAESVLIFATNENQLSKETAI